MHIYDMNKEIAIILNKCINIKERNINLIFKFISGNVVCVKKCD